LQASKGNCYFAGITLSANNRITANLPMDKMSKHLKQNRHPVTRIQP
jgi:hypothetical protein